MSQQSEPLPPLPARPRHIKLLGPPCNCKPTKLSVLKQVEESTTNFGAFYYKCDTCRYFKWATDSGKSIDYGDLWAPCCLLHPNRKCKLLQIARNSKYRGKLFWICGVLDKPCTHFQLFEGNIEDYKEFVPNFDESLLEIKELESSQSSQTVMSELNSRNLMVGLPEEIVAEILKYLEILPDWFRIMPLCKEWKRMIDNVIDDKVREGKIDLNLGFLHPKTPFRYFCEIFKRFYKVRKLTICNFELYSELMRLIEWVGVEIIILFNRSTRHSLNEKDNYDCSDSVEHQQPRCRSKCTEMSFYHIHGKTLLYNFNSNHINQHLNDITSHIYFDFVKEMESKVDTTHRRQFQELAQIIAINCPEDLNFVWLNGTSRSYYGHEQLVANFGDLIDLPYTQEELATIAKCHVDVFSLPTEIKVGFLNISILGHYRKPKIFVKNGKQYIYPTTVHNQIVTHPEVQKQFIRNSGIAKYYNINLIDISKNDQFKVAVDSGIIHFENIHKHSSFKVCLDILKKTLMGNIKAKDSNQITLVWSKTCVERLVFWMSVMHLKGLVKHHVIPSIIVETAKEIDLVWKQRKLLFSQNVKFQVDYEDSVGAIRVPFSWECFVTCGELRYLYDEMNLNSTNLVVEKNAHRRTSELFTSLNQPKKRKLQ